jgi:hypothetical protein
MCGLAVALLVTCGVIGSLFPGMGIGRLAAKAGVCVAVWAAAFAALPAEDRSRVHRTLGTVRARGRRLMARRGGLA